MATLQTPFAFGSTADDVLAGVDLSGKTVIITGGSGGIGKEIGRALANAGAAVIVSARDAEAAAPLVAELRKTTGNPHVEVRALDLSSLASVHRFVAEWNRPIDALVNNAGIMALPQLQRTPDGRELQFATNFLGHFALTCGLQPWLRERGGRVVSVASTGSLFGPVMWDDPDFRFVQYDPLLAYAQSKTACILLSVAIAQRWAATGITSNALHPGAIATNLQRHTGGLRTPEAYRKTPEQGAATAVLLAASPFLDGVSGRYFEDCNEVATVSERPQGRASGVAAYALNPANADRLWSMASAMIGGVA
ncbi:SDR family NAD(P)-dependent oxidoreductase [Microvirga antarctica]|uniref:SDR family NAD(P)-dependent oxidoreductase n=1 Tax=Microvirga antarctica TaxID=2819233 RepID=UPI001B30231F|nr:SDR family NAD(P)-dependent oxidoreductase [Microvirga antarctica]